MNDFTQEELDKLKLAIMILYDKDGLLDTKRIAYRIQEMIDNYCEHKKSGQVSDVDYVEICTECEEITGWI